MDIDWREHRRWVVVDGDPVNVVDLGSPEDETPFVFVHGLSGSWQNWLENLPHFARRHRVIAMDLPGFGASPMPSWDISIKRYGQFLHRLLDVLEVPGAAVVVGNSMGGFIAAELAISEPQRVERLVLVSAAGLSIEAQPWGHVVPALRIVDDVVASTTAWFVSRFESFNSRPRVRTLLTGYVIAHPDRLPAALLAEQVRGSGKPGFVPALAALTSYPIRDRLQDIACPTLVVWGGKDRLVPVKDAWEFERLIPDARAEVWEDTGHMPQLERPDAFNELLERFEAALPGRLSAA